MATSGSSSSARRRRRSSAPGSGPIPPPTCSAPRPPWLPATPSGGGLGPPGARGRGPPGPAAGIRAPPSPSTPSGARMMMAEQQPAEDRDVLKRKLQVLHDYLTHYETKLNEFDTGLFKAELLRDIQD